MKKLNVDRIDVNKYPAIKRHLDNFYERLKSRSDKGDTPYNLRSCAYMDEFLKPKIAWQRITEKNKFALIEKNIYILDSMAFIIAKEDVLKYLLVVLNSSLMYFWIKMNVHEYGSTGFRLSNQYVEEMPVVKLNSVEMHQISLLIESLYYHDKSLIVDSEIISKELDDAVYTVYELNKKEVDYILKQIK